MVTLNIDSTGKLDKDKPHVVKDSIEQIKLLCYIAILCRFMHDQSFMLALLNIFIISIIDLMNTLITYHDISVVDENGVNDGENNANDDETEMEMEILQRVVRKFSKNLQILIVLQILYSMLYHYYLPEDAEKNILVNLLYVEFGFDYGKEGGPPKWVAYVFVVAVDLLVLGCELILLNLNRNFLELRLGYGLPLNTTAGIFRDMTIAGVVSPVSETSHPATDVGITPILPFLTENYNDSDSQLRNYRGAAESLTGPGGTPLYGSIV